MNDKLKIVTERLQKNINSVPSRFHSFSEEDLRKKPAPKKWSKKEILGHLIDSAANNHRRFVKAQFEDDPFEFDSYQQDDWVRVQNYNELDTDLLVELWETYNKHILWIISNFDESKLGMKWLIEGYETSGETMLFLLKDYVDHMDHHLRQIF